MSADGLILFAHGARDPAWARPFEAVAAEVLRVQPALALRLAYLEIMSPDLIEAGRQLAAEGCIRVQVLPLFLGTGGHLRQDLPPMIEQLRRELPHVAWAALPAAGEHTAVVRAMAGVALAALHGDEATTP
jgi:sirohydrochlorin cobaltochelatase